MRSSTRTARWLTAAALAGALGFGGAQALAAPSQPDPPPDTCNPGLCMSGCRLAGYDGGFCFSGDCICYTRIS
jgi:hypothetical protein